MQNAPSVVFPVGRCAFHGGLLLVLGMAIVAVGALFLAGLGGGTLGAWIWFPGVAGAVAWLIWAAWAFLSWQRSPRGSLRWEPQRGAEGGAPGTWSWIDRSAHEPQALSDVERVLDLQGRVLLRVCGAGVGRQWVWVERSGAPAHWNDLRRALLSGRH